MNLVCKKCGTQYYESNNIGKWQCYQHVFTQVKDDDQRWPCCNQKKNEIVYRDVGCIKCDHINRLGNYHEEDNVVISSEDYDNVIKPIKASVVKISNDNTAVTISRFDRAATLKFDDDFTYRRY